MRWTTTTYDLLSRPLLITAPDGSRSEHHYGVVASNGAMLVYDDMVDPNRHRTQTRTDAFGRLVEVHEIAGDCGLWSYTCTGTSTTPWAPYAITRYTYNALDLLTGVADAHANTTNIVYDSLKRKTGMADPDMGTWSYQYDANGNLIRQIDAKGQTITFQYDALNRLTEKRRDSSSGGLLRSYSYDETGVPGGRGRRTSMQTYGGGGEVHTRTRWEYDARGRVSLTAQSTPLVQGAPELRLLYTYDSADRVRTIRYQPTDIPTTTWAISRPGRTPAGGPRPSATTSATG